MRKRPILARSLIYIKLKITLPLADQEVKRKIQEHKREVNKIRSTRLFS